jgi:hypothetical protein
MIAVSHPGKTGDAIYSLPTIRYLCEKHNCKADFYTSSHVARAKDLFEYQSCINKVIIPESYVIERYDMGIQPTVMPVEGEYEAVYHLGYKYVPDQRLDWFIAHQNGIDTSLLPPVYYEFPEYDINLPEKFYVLAGSGETGYKQTFLDFLKISDLPVIQVGVNDHYLNVEESKSQIIKMMDMSFLETCYVMSKSAGFVGLQTNQMVLANGFDIPKVAPHDGKSWDMRHVINGPKTHYPVDPTAEEILRLLKG